MGKTKVKESKKPLTLSKVVVYLINSPCDHNYHSGRLGICCIC